MTTAQDILNHKGTHVATIERSRTVVEAAEQMNALRIGCLVVTDHMRVVGIFTERDILVRVVAERRNPETTPVGSAMTSPIICCGPHTELDACREIVTEQRIRHIPVIWHGELAGIITSGDIMAREAFDREETIESLYEYIGGPAVRATAV
jgi:CBS domain-containing protein